MKLALSIAAILGVLLSSLSFVRDARASELEWLCGDYAFLGSAKEYVGRLENRRPVGLVLYDARSDSGRVLALYAYGPRPGESGRQGCLARFGKIEGDILTVPLGGGVTTTFAFEESGEVSIEWSRKHRNGKTEKLTGKLK